MPGRGHGTGQVPRALTQQVRVGPEPACLTGDADALCPGESPPRTAMVMTGLTGPAAWGLEFIATQVQGLLL